MSVTGRCNCGIVRFRIDGEMRPVVACHCAQCRKTSGHHVAATSVFRDAIVIEGDVTWYQSSESARRGFCSMCGSNLFWDGPGENLSVFAGVLDRPTGLKLAGHIYTADQGDYYKINDGLPSALGDDPGLSTVIR